MEPQRAAVYLRLSEMTDSTTSPDRQRQACADFVASRGWAFAPLSDVYEDWDRSAYSGRSRPSFDRLLRALAAGSYSHLVVYRLDRLSRSFAQWGRVFEACESAGVVIYSATEGIDSAAARPVFGVLAGLAWSESSTISARVRAARAEQFRHGRWPGGNRPFGWSPVPHPSGRGVTLALHPVESPHLLDAVDRVLTGTSLRSICAGWNSSGIRTTLGKTWHPSRLVTQLRSPLLKGYRVERGEPVVDERGVPVVFYPPLIDADKWARLQRALAERSVPPPGGLQSLLSGVMECGLCGGPMVGPGNSAASSATYRCANRATRGAGVCQGVAVSARRMDASVAEWVAVRGPAALELLEPPEETAGERAAIAELEGQLERWQDLYASGDITRARYDEKTAPLVALLEERHAGLAARQQEPRQLLREALEGRRPEAVLAHFADLPRRQQRQVVAGLIARLVVGPATAGRGMKGVPRGERWTATLRDRVTIELRGHEGHEFPASDVLGELVMPFGTEDLESEEGIEFLHALEADARHDRRRGLD